MIFDWLVLVFAIAVLTFYVGLLYRYAKEFEKADPYMQRYNQSVKENNDR